MNKTKLLIWLFIVASFAFAEWPEELLEPVKKDARKEKPLLSHEQINGRSTYETKNKINIIREDTSSKITQSIYYNFYDDFPLLQKKHYLNLDGELLKKTFPFSFTEVGLDWSPSFLLHKNQISGLSVGSLRLGPMARINLANIPILIKGGGALDVWNDSLRQDLYRSHFSETNVDGGGYVGMEIGDNCLKLFPKFPLYAHGGIWGTYMANSNITSGLFSTLLYKDIPKIGDFSIYVSDTLSKGRLTNYSGGDFSTVDYSSSYDRTTNDFKTMVGLKDIGTWYIMPSILYSIDINTMNYPFSNKNFDEFRNIDNSITFFLATKENKYFNYDGGWNFQFINYDMMYRDDLPDSALIDSDDEDLNNAIIANEDDMNGVFVELYSDVYINFLDKFQLSYSMNLNKFDKDYHVCNTYSNGKHTISNERDEVNYEHDVKILKNFNEKISLQAFFEYDKNMNIFIFGDKSASNNIIRKYLLGTQFLVVNENGSYAKEAIDITNSQEEFPDYVKEYLKNEYLAGNDQKKRPYFTRKLSSRFDWLLNITNKVSLSGFWYETFRDKGYWDIETWKSEVGLGTNRYIIEHKHIETNLQGVLILSPIKYHQYKFGASFQNFINYIYSTTDEGLKEWIMDPEKLYKFNFNPFIEFAFLLNDRFLLKGNVKCNSRFSVDTYNERKNEKDISFEDMEIDFWEAGTSLEVRF